MKNFILIDSKTRTPVPLPFYAIAEDMHLGQVPVTVHSFSSTLCFCDQSGCGVAYKPSSISPLLEIITEADFMAECE